MYDRLLSPIKLGSLELPNRILMPAMQLNLTPMGKVTDEMVDFFVARAKGDVGLIIIGACTINAEAGGPFFLSVQGEEDLPGLTRLATAIHEAGGRAGLQLYHGGAYVHSFLIGGGPAVSASELPSGLTGETPRALETEEVKALVNDFVNAAERTQKAGFDCCELCGSAGYIIAQFLSPRTNQRTDEYGGDEARRMRFGVEIVEKIRERLGPDFPVLIRLAGNSFVPGAGDSALTARFAVELEKAGVDGFDITGGWHETRVPQLTGAVPTAGLSYLARVVKEKVSVPVVACNRITTPAEAEAVLANGHGDLVGLGRGLIADAEFALKARDGRDTEIVHCISCNQGCFDAVFNLAACRCMTNPISLREGDLGELKPAEKPLRVTVVGAGPAGLAVAWSAARRGHSVVVLEKADNPGGQLHLAGVREDRHGFWQLSNDLTQRAILAGAEIRYGTTADPVSIKALEPDVVVLATGAKPAVPPFEGVDLDHVVQSWDVLANRVECGDRVVVVGGGATGCETALQLSQRGTIDAETVAFLLINQAEPPEEIVRLATQGTREVTLVEMARKIGADIGKSTRWGVIQDLSRYGVNMLKNTEVVRITAEAVVVKTEDGERELACDHVVLAAGVEKEVGLSAGLDESGFRVEVIGDAKNPRKAIEAIHEGFDLGWEL